MTYYIRNPGPILKVRMMGISLLAKSATFSRPRSASVQLGYQEGLCYHSRSPNHLPAKKTRKAVQSRDARLLCLTFSGKKAGFDLCPVKLGTSLRIVQNEP